MSNVAQPTARPVVTFPASVTVPEMRAALAPRFPALAAAWARESVASKRWAKVSESFGEDSREARDAERAYTRAWDAAYALVKATVEFRFEKAVA